MANYPTVYQDQHAYGPPHPAPPIPQAQPVYIPPGQAKEARWSAGLGGCLGDIGICCLGYFLPCVLYGQNVETLTGEACCAPCCIYFLLSAFGCCACYACGTRERLRKKYGLPASPCNDCCVHCFCCVCALCQEAREMRIQATKASYIAAPHMPPPQQAMHYQ